MGTVSLFLLFLAVGLATSQVSYGDPCYLIPFTNTGKWIDLEIPSNCTTGSVDWNYPRGTINLHLTRPNSPYTLCLETSWTTNLGGLKKVVNGVETDVPLPTRDSATCTEDVEGKARFLVSAISSLLYMTEFTYRVVLPVNS